MAAPSVSLVTGSAGSAHVTSAQAGILNAGIFGEGSYILNVGNKLACTLGANVVNVSTGSAVHNGRQIDVGTAGQVSFASGTAGKYRHDLIVLRYTKVGAVESASIVCIQGTEATTQAGAADPSYNTGSILEGASTSDMVLCRLVFNQASVSIQQVASIKPRIAQSVIDAGTSNGWYWRKYSDGTVDAWLSHSMSYAISEAAGYMYSVTINGNQFPAYPTNLFTAAPEVYATLSGGANPLWVTFWGLEDSGTSYLPKMCILSTHAGSGTVKSNIHVHGRWQ